MYLCQKTQKYYPLIEKVFETQIEGQCFRCFSGDRPKTKIPFESLPPLVLLFDNRDNPVLKLAHIHVPKFMHTRVKVLQKSHMYDFPYTHLIFTQLLYNCCLK